MVSDVGLRTETFSHGVRHCSDHAAPYPGDRLHECGEVLDLLRSLAEAREALLEAEVQRDSSDRHAASLNQQLIKVEQREARLVEAADAMADTLAGAGYDSPTGTQAAYRALVAELQEKSNAAGGAKGGA